MTNKVRVYEDEPITLIKRKHELESTLKAIQKGSKAAVERLVEAVKNEPDEEGKFKYSEKVSVDSARALLGLEKSYAEQINRDGLQRQLAEIRLKSERRSVDLIDIEDDDVPLINFDDIQEIE